MMLQRVVHSFAQISNFHFWEATAATSAQCWSRPHGNSKKNSLVCPIAKHTFWGAAEPSGTRPMQPELVTTIGPCGTFRNFAQNLPLNELTYQPDPELLPRPELSGTLLGTCTGTAYQDRNLPELEPLLNHDHLRFNDQLSSSLSLQKTVMIMLMRLPRPASQLDTNIDTWRRTPRWSNAWRMNILNHVGICRGEPPSHHGLPTNNYS